MALWGRLKRYMSGKMVGNLRTQLMLTTVGPVIALLVAVAMVGFFGLSRLTQTLVEERDSELVQLAARQVAGYWADSVLLLTQVAATDVVRNGNTSASQALLGGDVAMALRQRFDQISITDVQGRVIASAGGELDEEVASQPFFERTRRLRRPVRSDVYANSLGQRVITVAVPVYDVWGRFAGCALGIWLLQGNHLGLPVAGLRVGESGYSYLIDEDGIILYHPSRELIGADSKQHPAVAALLRGEIGAQTVNVNGRTTVVGYAPIPLRQLTSSVVADETWDGWGLLTAESWDDIVAPLTPYVRLLIVLLSLLVTLPLVFLALNSQRVVAPLQSLVTQAERVASGQFDSQVSINAGPSEVRELEMAFNAMVDQLRKYQSDIQNYVVAILNSQEAERKRIARELHDETAQALIVLGRRIEAAEEASQQPDLRARLNALRDMVDDTLHGVRRFTSDLRPPLLEELGLPRTLELLGDRVDREEAFAVSVSIEGDPIHLLPELELGLYRLAQECLSNVRRHAHAHSATMRLIYASDSVSLEILDDGVGFEAPGNATELMRSGRLGLMGIYERARLFGGKATIKSAAGQGTRVTVVIPLTSIVMPTNTTSAVEEALDSIGKKA